MSMKLTAGRAWPFPTAANHPPADPSVVARVEEPTEDALDHGIEESFPASDPVSVSISKISPATAGPAPELGNSVAGEEDPGASLDLPDPQPGDEAPPGTQGTGEGVCRECGGAGRTETGEPCPACSGTGKVTVGIGGA
jgi:hypothetical protein